MTSQFFEAVEIMNEPIYYYSGYASTEGPLSGYPFYALVDDDEEDEDDEL